MHAAGLVVDDGLSKITDLGRSALHRHERENIDAARKWLGARTGAADDT